MKKLKDRYDEIIWLLKKIEEDVNICKTEKLSKEDILLLKKELVPVLKTIEKELLHTADLIEYKCKQIH